jgi:hypothetical protein
MVTSGVFKATVAKDDGLAGTNEDRVLLLLREHRILLLDGASDSYAPRAWVKCLEDCWRREKACGTEKLAAAVRRARTQYVSRVPPPDHWAQEVAYERGSFATLLDVRWAGATIRMVGVGDACAMAVGADGSLVWSFPMENYADFTSVPHAVGSLPTDTVREQELFASSLQEFTVSADAQFLVLATDAVAAWLLADDLNLRQVRMQRLLAVASKAQFAALVQCERAAGTMRRDDSTVAVVHRDRL